MLIAQRAELPPARQPGEKDQESKAAAGRETPVRNAAPAAVDDQFSRGHLTVIREGSGWRQVHEATAPRGCSLLTRRRHSIAPRTICAPSIMKTRALIIPARWGRPIICPVYGRPGCSVACSRTPKVFARRWFTDAVEVLIESCMRVRRSKSLSNLEFEACAPQHPFLSSPVWRSPLSDLRTGTTQRILGSQMAACPQMATEAGVTARTDAQLPRSELRAASAAKRNRNATVLRVNLAADRDSLGFVRQTSRGEVNHVNPRQNAGEDRPKYRAIPLP